MLDGPIFRDLPGPTSPQDKVSGEKLMLCPDSELPPKFRVAVPFEKETFPVHGRASVPEDVPLNLPALSDVPASTVPVT
jgi:hypothetical protein